MKQDVIGYEEIWCQRLGDWCPTHNIKIYFHLSKYDIVLHNCNLTLVVLCPLFVSDSHLTFMDPNVLEPVSSWFMANIETRFRSSENAWSYLCRLSHFNWFSLATHLQIWKEEYMRIKIISSMFIWHQLIISVN